MKKETVVAMRLSFEDAKYIKDQAEKERLTKSAWIRRKIFINN